MFSLYLGEGISDQFRAHEENWVEKNVRKKCACVYNNTAAPTPPQCPHLATFEHTHIYMTTCKWHEDKKIMRTKGNPVWRRRWKRGGCARLKKRWNVNKTTEVWRDEGWERHIQNAKSENIDFQTNILGSVNLVDTQTFSELNLYYELCLHYCFNTSLSHSPSLPQTPLVFSVSLAPSLPVDWGPQVGERGTQRRRERLLFPHNNRGIHGHPAPHQSTERDGGGGKIERWERWREGWVGRGEEGTWKREECVKRGRVDFQGEVNRGCRGINKGEEETGWMWGEAAGVTMEK